MAAQDFFKFEAAARTCFVEDNSDLLRMDQIPGQDKGFIAEKTVVEVAFPAVLNRFYLPCLGLERVDGMA